MLQTQQEKSGILSNKLYLCKTIRQQINKQAHNVLRDFQKTERERSCCRTDSEKLMILTHASVKKVNGTSRSLTISRPDSVLFVFTLCKLEKISFPSKSSNKIFPYQKHLKYE